MLLAECFDQVANREGVGASRLTGVPLRLLDLREREPRLSREARRRQSPLCLLCEFDSRLGITRGGVELTTGDERSRALNQR